MHAKIALFLLLVLVLGACSTAPIIIPAAEQYQNQIQPSARPDKALVYFFADQAFESGFFSITRGGRYAILNGDENGTEIAVLGCAPAYESRAIHHECRSYTWVYVTPGTYRLTAMFTDHHGTGETISANLAAGSISYFQVVDQPAAFSSDIELFPVDQSTAISIMSEGYKYCAAQTCDIPTDETYQYIVPR